MAGYGGAGYGDGYGDGIDPSIVQSPAQSPPEYDRGYGDSYADGYGAGTQQTIQEDSTGGSPGARGYGDGYGDGYGGSERIVGGGGAASGLQLLESVPIGPYSVALRFNKSLVHNAARLAPASYEVTPGATVVAVHDVGDTRQIALEMSDDLILGTDYTVTIVGDLEGL